MHKPVPAIAAFLLGGTAFAQSQRPNVILFVVADGHICALSRRQLRFPAWTSITGQTPS